jgi:hypothetical protein
MQLIVVMPVYNDWAPARELLARLDRAFTGSAHQIDVLLVDDASSEPMPTAWAEASFAALASVSVLTLKANLGHQRAIAVALSHISEKMRGDLVLVMDGDGEDEPADAVRLVDEAVRLDLRRIVFAQRTRRSESFQFRCGYLAYQAIHQLLTGRGIDIGNFSAIPASFLTPLALNPLLWNHYAASVVSSRLTHARIPTTRGRRIGGRSHSNTVSLVTHGLQALACYSDIIGVRILAMTGIVSLAALAGCAIILYEHVFASNAVTGGSSMLLLIITALVLQVFTIALNFTLQIISTRRLQPFIPARDYVWYVSRSRTVWPEEKASVQGFAASR